MPVKIADPAAKLRGRVFDFRLWQESTDFRQLVQYIEHKHLQAAISPIHDQDVYDDEDVTDWVKRHLGSDGKLSPEDEQAKPKPGDLKKAHWHVLVSFKGNKSVAQVLELFKPFDLRWCEVTQDKWVMLRYFCHIDSPYKAQYDINDMLAFGGMDLSCLTAISDKQRLDNVKSLQQFVREYNVFDFCDLADYAAESDNYQMYECVVNKCSFWGLYLNSARSKYDSEEHHG